MKRIIFSLAIAALLMSGCYKDDINDLKDKYKDLQAQLDKQAQDYQTILSALQNQLTVTAVAPISGGYSIVFSNGSTVQVKEGNTPVFTVGENGNWYVDGVDTGAEARGQSGQSGATPEIRPDGYWWINNMNTGVKAEGVTGNHGTNAPVITAIIIQNGEMTFTFSEGNSITVPMAEGAAPYIVSIVEVAGVVTYYYSDGSTITMSKKTETVLVGLWYLSEGYMGMGNGQLVYYDYNSATDRFVRDNSKGFPAYAETPNDLKIYGSNMYAAITGVTNDGFVRVINPATGAIIRDIVISHNSVQEMPRRLAVTNGKVYATLYSGAVAEIDTASFTYRTIGLTGTFSEGISVHGQSLYICNSGQGFGNTISVVSIASFTETSSITVAQNPVNIVNVGNGELYFNTADVSWAGGDPANLYVLNASSNTVSHTLNVPVESIAFLNGYVYGVGFDWNDWETTMKKINIADKSVSDFVDDPDDYFMSYKVSVNPLTNEIFVSDQGDKVWRFKEDGTEIEELTTGVPCGTTAVFVNTVKTTYSIIE